ncbi:MAG: hypothetical protein HYX68_00270 [Planctomycetes bacterium]|nr:hypothetical protein [Planctomycetota bacterium]
MAPSIKKTAVVCLALGAAALGMMWWTGWPIPWGSAPPPTVMEIPLPAISGTRFLNASADARFIGSAACAKCHNRQHQTYLLTPHSKALSDLDPKAEPPDGAFEHKASGRSYRVYRAGGKLRHEEILRTEAGKEIARIDLPVRYLIGSGAFARTYLVEVDGFLHESPITWYPSKKKWDVSPGYDFQQHHGFERPIRLGCVACHAGRVENTDGAAHRITFHEKAIGCESCHGPGSIHQQRRARNEIAAGEEDLTIVNPGKLSRPLQESICASCHLSGAATIQLRGRAPTDYRPGLPVNDFRAEFRFDDSDDRMTVVGHVEQMRQSACYQKSKDLTCLTCHDPHQRTPVKDVVGHFRKKCQSCHETRTCALPAPERLKKQPADNCVACHMPRGDTEIPHIAFTHHRIGKHDAQPPRLAKKPRVLKAMDENPRLSKADKQRNLGLAYLELVRDPVHAEFGLHYRASALRYLESAHAAGLRDAGTCQGLAEIFWHDDPERAGEFARQALAAKSLSPNLRALALLIAADVDFRKGDFDAAIPRLQELTRLRRFAEDWRLLGVSYLEQKKPALALKTLEQALAIRPYRATTHLALAEVFRRLSDPSRALEHDEKAQWLQEHRQD